MKMWRNAQFANSTLNGDLWFREVYRLKSCIYKMLCGPEQAGKQHPDHKIMTAKSGIPMEFTFQDHIVVENTYHFINDDDNQSNFPGYE